MITVQAKEVILWGCPYCGFRSMGISTSMGNSHIANCGECSDMFGVVNGPSSNTDFKVNGEPLVVVDHPRKGIPNHGTPDERPADGEYFRVRGLGLDNIGGCFVCGELLDHCCSNISGFVKCKASGERIAKLFPSKIGHRLDYREYEPDRVQFKIGACDVHKPNLELLQILVGDTGVITEGLIKRSIGGTDETN